MVAGDAPESLQKRRSDLHPHMQCQRGAYNNKALANARQRGVRWAASSVSDRRR